MSLAGLVPAKKILAQALLSRFQSLATPATLEQYVRVLPRRPTFSFDTFLFEHIRDTPVLLDVLALVLVDGAHSFFVPL